MLEGAILSAASASRHAPAASPDEGARGVERADSGFGFGDFFGLGL